MFVVEVEVWCLVVLKLSSQPNQPKRPSLHPSESNQIKSTKLSLSLSLTRHRVQRAQLVERQLPVEVVDGDVGQCAERPVDAPHHLVDHRPEALVLGHVGAGRDGDLVVVIVIVNCDCDLSGWFGLD